MATTHDDLIMQPLTAEELARWPLTHGTPAHGDELERIRAEGLIAGRGSNSYGYDAVLGREKCVFFAPATFRLHYGGNSILIDPSILARQDIKCSDGDIGDVFTCLEIIAEDGPDAYAGEVRDVPKLTELLASVRENTSLTDPKKLANEVFRLEQFKNYLSNNYQLAVGELFCRLEVAGKSMSLKKYFSRTNLWKEEIFVPEKVVPAYLLGHWDGQRWTAWKRPESRETQVRLEAWLDAAAKVD